METTPSWTAIALVVLAVIVVFVVAVLWAVRKAGEDASIEVDVEEDE